MTVEQSAPSASAQVPTPMVEVAALASRSAVLIGNGGGSDSLATVLVATWLRSLGVPRITCGGVACQWWPESDREGFVGEVVGPDLYDPAQLRGARPIHPCCVLIDGSAELTVGQRPHEATLAEAAGESTFVLSLLGGADGLSSGLAALAQTVEADLIISVDVGSDTLSTGHEVRPAATALVDHLMLTAIASQQVASYFALAALGADAEMEPSEIERNLGVVIQAGGLRGTIAAGPKAVEDYEKLIAEAPDPVGRLVSEALRGRFGLHRVAKNTPWGEVAKLTAASVPIWVMCPHTVLENVATDAQTLAGTTTLQDAERRYLECGRIPETTIVRSVDFDRQTTRQNDAGRQP